MDKSFNAVEREQSGTQFPGQGTHLMFPPGKAVNIVQPIGMNLISLWD